MDLPHLDETGVRALDELLGYLNFSAGSPDVGFERNLNLLFARLERSCRQDRSEASPLHVRLEALLRERLQVVAGTAPAFVQVDQAQRVIDIAFEQVLPAYRAFHADLLAHQSDEGLFRPFFLAKVCEATLAELARNDEQGCSVPHVVQQLNDYIGHRPVAVLRTPQKIEPYDHEWVRPVPVYLHGAGVAAGEYEGLISRALDILREVPEGLRDQAEFDPELLEELAYDPRAYDFDHPVNKRPNYHFGQWDPHHIDTKGHYRRFVLQQVTLDVLLERVRSGPEQLREEYLWEASAVLAGTMLMASGISGNGPETHESSVTLAGILPRIAEYRDAYYAWLLGQREGGHGDRLRAEAAALHQPLGGARQQLNQGLARRRAWQLQHVHLAKLYARMGYPAASLRQAAIVPVASARMTCEIQCRIVSGLRAVQRGDLDAAVEDTHAIADLLQRAIECGALPDPWNVLGFQGQFSVFQALENSVRDHRLDELIELVGQWFGFCARLAGEAAAQGAEAQQRMVLAHLQRHATWWDQFATIQVSSVQSVLGADVYDAAVHVAGALGAWHAGGAATGDLSFWREHVEEFDSPKAYALVIEALLEKRDFVASMALLIQWLSRADEIPLEEEDAFWQQLAERWLEELHWPVDGAAEVADRWALTRKFFDYLEANAEEYWLVPHFNDQALPPRPRSHADTDALEDLLDESDESALDDGDEEDEQDQRYRAAYEEMTYRDSTGDGNEGDMLEAGATETDYILDYEGPRLAERLSFLTTLGRMWTVAAAADAIEHGKGDISPETLQDWLTQSLGNRRGLLELLERVQEHRLPKPLGTHASLVEYDRRRMAKQNLMERITTAYVDTAAATRFVVSAGAGAEQLSQGEPWEKAAAEIIRCLMGRDPVGARESFPRFLESMRSVPLLYVPLVRGGNPQETVRTQVVNQILRDVLGGLPRMGLFREAYQLLEAAHDAERERTVSGGAVTEFDRLFHLAHWQVSESIVESATQWDVGSMPGMSDARIDDELVGVLQQATEALLPFWLSHSRRLRLSMLERVAGENSWQELVQFIRKYGHDVFTPRFLNLGNLRAISDRGVDEYLTQLEQSSEEGQELALLADLDKGISRRDAVRHLETVVAAVGEHYAEYKDFNLTTTQSDHGDLLFMLLDFLRLKVRYERISWNLRPVVTVHQILVRHGRFSAAEQWRRVVNERTAEAADRLIAQHEQLSRNYGMQLSTVTDRLRERFVKPLELDRVRALVQPAIEEASHEGPAPTFDLFEQELGEFTQQPTGAGLDLPPWLAALEQEVEQARRHERSGGEGGDFLAKVPAIKLTLDEVREKMNEWQELMGPEDEAERT
jgi:hypothetical protein